MIATVSFGAGLLSTAVILLFLVVFGVLAD